MDRSSGFGSTPCYSTPLSDSLSLRLPYSVKLATQRKSLTHYTKGTPSPCSIGLQPIEQGDGSVHSRVQYAYLSVQSTKSSRSSLRSNIFCCVSPASCDARSDNKELRGKDQLSRAPTVCMHAVSGSISLPSRGSFRLSLTVLVHYRSITSI